MVSGFLISPYDQDRIFSGDAIEIRIWSKTWAGVVGLKRFIISWFIIFSSRADRHRQQIRNSFSAAPRSTSKQGANARHIRAKTMLRAGAPDMNSSRYSAASEVDAGPTLELCRSTLRPSERISLTSTL